VNRQQSERTVIRELDLTGLPHGEVLRPMEPVPDAEQSLYAAWECPLSPWGGFRVGAGMTISEHNGRPVLRFEQQRQWERAIVARDLTIRDGILTAEIMPTGTSAAPHNDRNDVTDALAGIVFRWETSRSYYQFGIEGRSRAVLYRRCDDEWFALAEQAVDAPDQFITLEVALSGDSIRCTCADLGVDFFVTDTTYPSGKAGVRVLAGAVLASFRIAQTPAQSVRDAQRKQRNRSAERDRGRDVPDARLVRTIDVQKLGGQPSFEELTVAGRYDMLVQGSDCLRALTADGEILWETDEPVRKCVLSREFTPHGKLIYGFAGLRNEREAVNVAGGRNMNTISEEMVVLRSDTGEIVARQTLPEEVPTQRMFDWSPTSASLSGGEPTDIVLREWRDDLGGGGVRLWALDRNLNLLWEHVQSGAHYGHHHAFALFDIDGDGRDELLAGGFMYRGDGTILWIHDRADEMKRITGADHYDAVALGNLAGEDEEDPTAFLIGGSAGVYTVDALTGETRSIHRVGHAQGRAIGKLRPDLPGVEVLVATRWENYGTLTLFSGRGERLWTIQPDYIGQGATPVTWGSAGHPLVWTNTSAQAQALWGGQGNRVKRLPALSETWGNRMSREVGRSGTPVRIGTDLTEYLTLTVDRVMHVFGPDE
jgi:hypothetical protein